MMWHFNVIIMLVYEIEKVIILEIRKSPELKRNKPPTN